MQAKIIRRTLMLAACAVFTIGHPVAADPDADGSVIINSVSCESLGIGSFCSDAVYSALEKFDVYTDTNPDNPLPSPGHFTYLFTIANHPDSVYMLGSLRRFDIATPPNATVDAGFLDGAGVEPNGVEVDATVVRWIFEVDFIDPGETSKALYLISPFGPTEFSGSKVAVGSAFAIDTPTTSVGPLVSPSPASCTVGFWKNRERGRKGLLKFFKGADFDAVKVEAVAISSVFQTQAELVAALTSRGRRDIGVRARRQLAALLLNVAAGNLFPCNSKCRLFLGEFGTQIDTTGDGVPDTALGDALALIEADILSGDPERVSGAHALAGAINNAFKHAHKHAHGDDDADDADKGLLGSGTLSGAESETVRPRRGGRPRGFRGRRAR